MHDGMPVNRYASIFKVPAAIGTAVLVLIIFMHSKRNEIERSTSATRTATKVQECGDFIAQRNHVSRLLNDMKREYGKSNCEYLELLSETGKKQDKRVSKFGGWCRAASSKSRSKGSGHAFDAALATALSEFLRGKQVASFGDGPGEYKRFIDDTKLLEKYDAFDGAPYGQETSEGRVRHLDLTAPQYGLQGYDWIVSLEVAEHIPGEFEKTFLDNIASHAKEGVVLSWAVPGQGGLSHVNNRPLHHVIQQFSVRGFSHCKEESEMLQKKASLSWLKRNVNVYRRTDPQTFHEHNV